MRRLGLLIALCAAVAPAAQAGASPAVRIMADHRAYAGPSRSADRLPSLAARRPLTSARTIVPLLADRVDASGGHWLKVALPGRPNGHSGWIGAHATRPARRPWRIVVELRRRRVSVLRGDRLARAFSAVVGAPSTPTPRGRFFVEESVALAPGRSGAPFALALSARSDVLHQFAGGPGQIAIHGRGGVGGTLGTAVSHGCIRLGRPAVSWMAAHIGAGTVVTVVGRAHDTPRARYRSP